jgi:disease resistance protein RPM1
MLLLKYLSLRGTDVKKLTEKIGDLRCLETLDIRETNIMELPKSICKLERLVSILGGNKKTMTALKLPMMLGINMKALRVLSGVAIGGDRISYYYFTKSKGLQKLAIYKIISTKGDPHFTDLISFIKYFHDLSLRSLVIHDESSEFFKSYSDCSDYPKLLNALELSGKFVELPKWIVKMDALRKLTLSLTALRADNLDVLQKICSLFSLTFSLHAAKQDQETDAIIENNKACSDGVILFSVGGFENLKLLRFVAPYVPQLSFPDGAVPTLEKLELRCSNFDGLVGIRGLKHLKQAHIKIHGETSEVTESIIKEMGTAAREDLEGPRIIFD